MINSNKKKAFNEVNYKLSSELQYSRIPELVEKVKECQEKSKDDHFFSEAGGGRIFLLFYKKDKNSNFKTNSR